MKKIILLLIALLTTLALVSCDSSNEATNTMPDMGVKANNWNTFIKLVDDPMLANTYKNGKDLTLRVENLSNNPIYFLENFGVKVILKNGQNWTDIQNNFYNSGTQYLPTKASYPLGLLVTSLPYIPNLSSPATVRVIIIGYAENNEEDLLGAFLDITITP